MYIFKKTKSSDNHYEIADITYEIETVSLPALIEEFESFLKGCGFQIESGSLQIVEEDCVATVE